MRQHTYQGQTLSGVAEAKGEPSRIAKRLARKQFDRARKKRLRAALHGIPGPAKMSMREVMELSERIRKDEEWKATGAKLVAEELERRAAANG